MAIPKIIHYCWFGGAPLPEIASKCLASWQTHCPDYQVMLWNETNLDMQACPFVAQAYEEKKWAFVSDYFRLKVVQKHGGIYLDIDVELLANLDALLTHDAFFGFEQSKNPTKAQVATGLGFGAKAGTQFLDALLASYENAPFRLPGGKLNTTPCPKRDTKVFHAHGLMTRDKTQTLHYQNERITVYASDTFAPISYYGIENYSDNTLSIHHYHGSWCSEKAQKRRLKKMYQIKHGKWLGYLHYLKDHHTKTPHST
jgi:hypothetical protein